MGTNLSREKLQSDFDRPRTNGTHLRKTNSARVASDFEQQHTSMSPFVHGKNENHNKPKRAHSAVGRTQKSSDFHQVHNNLVGELKEFQKMRKTPVSDSVFLQPNVTVPQFNERLVAPTFRSNDTRSNNVKTEPKIWEIQQVGHNLPQPLRKAPTPPPRIRSNNSGNKTSEQQSNNVVKNQRGIEVQPPRANSSAGGMKIDSQQQLNIEPAPKTRDSLYEKCYDPKDATLRFVNDEDSLDLLFMGFKSPRALMSCGHAVTPTSLTVYCYCLLEEGVSDFVCLGCKALWSFEEVCKMALLTPEEIKHFEKKISDIKTSRLDFKSEEQGNKVQQTSGNSSAEETKIESQQPNAANYIPEHMNNEPEPEMSDALPEKCYDPMDTTLIFTEAEDTLDFLCEEFESPRALMSCGHAVTPMSLTLYCDYLLEECVTDFVCGVPDCGALWSFEEVCKMALFTPEEMEYFERKLVDLKKEWFDVKQCPGCKSEVLRSDLSSLCVECTVCTADKKRVFLFCWQCLRKWRGPSSRSDRCDNEGCTNQNLGILKNCPEITFEDVKGVVGCPSIRACPCCGLLVAHNNTKCKYIFCNRCKKKFCFVCLELENYCLENSDYYEPCFNGVAPRQTSIPVPKI